MKNNEEKNNGTDKRKPGNWKWFMLAAMYIFCPAAHEAVIHSATLSIGFIENTIFHLGRKLRSCELVVSLSSGGNIASVTLGKHFL